MCFGEQEGNVKLASPVRRTDGGVDMLASFTVQAADIDAQLQLERERGVERQSEDGTLGDEDLESIANALQQDGRGIESILTPGEPLMMVREIQRSRAAIARVEALIERLRRISTAIGVKYADDFEAALRGERSGK